MVDYDDILKYIQEEIIPKYPEIESCNLHVLPENVKERFLFICKVPVDLFIDEKKFLENKIIEDLGTSFDTSFIDKVNVIFLQF